MRPLALLALIATLGAGCPATTPHPAAPRFSKWDHKARLTKALKALYAKGPPALRRDPVRELRAAHLLRDRGWLLLMHFGDAKRASQRFGEARQVVRGRPLPWVTAGEALIAEQRANVSAAAAAYLKLLGELTKEGTKHGQAAAPSAAPSGPPGLDPQALALLAAGRLRALTQQLPKPLRPAQIPPNAAALGAPANHALGVLRLELARQRGKQSAIAALRQALGCQTHWRISPRVGRFGPPDLTRRFAQDNQADQAALAGRAAKSPCRLLVSSPDGRAGIRYVEAEVRRDRRGPATLVVAWHGPFLLSINGKPAAGTASRFAALPILRRLRVTLEAGVNRLRFKLPVSALPSWLQLQVQAADKLPKPRAPASKDTSWHARRAYRPLADALSMSAALHRGLPDAGRQAQTRLLADAPHFLAGVAAAVRLELADPLEQHAQKRTRARLLLRRALKRSAKATALRLQLVGLKRRRSKSLAALKLLTAQPPAAGAAHLFLLAKARLYRELGWHALAHRLAEKLTTDHPDWAAGWRLFHLLARRDSSAKDRRRAARRLRALDATSTAWASVLAAQGQLAEAMQELKRAIALRPGGDREALLARWSRLAGKPKAATIILHRLLASQSWEPEHRLALADLLVKRGKRNAALDLLRAGRRARPELADYRRALAALGQRDPLLGLRLEGAPLIAAYRKSAWGAGTTPVYVLDRSVIWVTPSGGQLTLVHQIVHLRNAAAIRRWAEVRLPPGAQILTLRTVKADGSSREPEEIGGKDSHSMPDVAVGDFIEVEYLSAQAAQRFWAAGGFYGSSFAFRSTAAHFYRSELVLSTPAALALQLGSWGPVPKPQTTTTTTGRKLTTWTARRVPRLQPEPLMPSLSGPLPTLLVGARVRWEDFLRQRQAQLWRGAVISHRLRQRAQALCGKAHPFGMKDQPHKAGPDADADTAVHLERLRKVYRWVQKNIEQSGNLFTSAAHTLSARAGSRLNLLRVLLQLCGARPVDTLLAQPRNKALPPSGLPLLRLYSQPLLRVQHAKQTYLLMPQLRQAPFGYLPPTLHGARAVSLANPKTPPIRLPDRQATERRDIRLQITLALDGSAVVSGQETLRGILALRLRAALRRMPARRLRQNLERGLFARAFPGARLTSLQFQDAKAPGKPLGMRYRLEVPQLARRVRAAGGKRHLALRSGFFPTHLGRVYARLPQRKLAMRLGPVGPTHLSVTLQAPEGHRFGALPKSLTLQTPFGSFTMKALLAEGQLRLTRRLTLPYRIVSPTQYPAFTRFAAQVDQAEQLIVILKPSGLP